MNSWSVSLAGTAMFGVEFVPIELASTPLMRTEFDVVRCPLTLIVASPRPNSVLFETEDWAPACSVRSCWKFRVGKGSWRSVIAYGRYEELAGDAVEPALTLLRERFARTAGRAAEPRKTGPNVVVLRISLDELSGRAVER